MLGTLNFIEPQKRVDAAALVREGRVVSLSQSFDTNGPQKGWRRRTNPVHTMTDTGVDAERGNQGFPHGIGGADDVIAMPLQCSTQWDGLGHIFDHGMAWNGRRAGDVVTSEGDLVTGIEHAASVVVSRGVLLDVGRHLQPESGELPDGYAVTTADLEATIAAQGASSAVGRGDIVLVRTGQLARARRDGWGDYAGGPAPGLSLTTAGWLHRTEIAAIATDTWGFEVRPNEFDAPAFQPLHQVVIPNLGLTIGEMWDLEALGAACAASGRYDFLLSAAPLPDHRRGRLAHQPRRDPLIAEPEPEPRRNREVSDMTAVNKVAIAGSGVAGLAAAIQLAKAGVTVDLFEAKPELSALGSGISLQGNALRVFDALGAWDDIREAGYPFEGLNLRAPGPDAPIVAQPARRQDRAGPTTRRRWGCRGPTSPASCSSTRSGPARTSTSARRSPASTRARTTPSSSSSTTSRPASTTC